MPEGISLRKLLSKQILDELKAKIANRTARVGVVGLGYVGLPFAVEKAKVGFHVTGIEQNPRRVRMINPGENYIADVRDEELRALVAEGRLHAEEHFDSVPAPDVIVICVPTPVDKNVAPDLRYCGQRDPRDRAMASPRPVDLSGVHDLSEHHRGSDAAHPGGIGPEGGTGLLPRSFARAG